MLSYPAQVCFMQTLVGWRLTGIIAAKHCAGFVAPLGLVWPGWQGLQAVRLPPPALKLPEGHNAQLGPPLPSRHTAGRYSNAKGGVRWR
jgi:hypothetical protein